MKNILKYVVSTSILSILIFLLANSIGISTIEVNCPQGVFDCGNASYYSPIFWWPMHFIRPNYSNPFVAAAWPGFNQGEFLKILSFSFIYWVSVALLVSLLFFKLIQSLKKQ